MARELLDAARANAISERSLYKAKQVLGIQEKKIGFQGRNAWSLQAAS